MKRRILKMNFKESYTSDTNIMDQWTKDMIKKLEKDQSEGKFDIYCTEKPSGKCLVAVFNKNNFRSDIDNLMRVPFYEELEEKLIKRLFIYSVL